MATNENSEVKFEFFSVKCDECQQKARIFVRNGEVVIECADCGQETGARG